MRYHTANRNSRIIISCMLFVIWILDTVYIINFHIHLFPIKTIINN